MPIDEVEIQAFFGILLIIRVLKARREPLKMLWPTIPAFRRLQCQGIDLLNCGCS
jgi:hypothetical protein